MSSSLLDSNFKNNKKKTQKRTRNPENHNAYQRKLCVQKGFEYKTKSGHVVKAKTFHGQTECGGCKKQCCEKIGIDRQKEIFETFYGLENWSKKVLFLRANVKFPSSKENIYSVKCTAKRNHYKYYLTDKSGKHEEVCHTFFLRCFQISQSKLNRVIRSVVTNESASDRRGKFPTRKTNINDLKFVKRFIRKFPCYQSHYGASKTEKKYLNPNLNIMRLYREYQLVCNFQKKKVVSEWKFRNIFNTKFNLGFKPNKTDTCRKCDKFNAVIQSERTSTLRKELVQQEKKFHLQIDKYIKKNFTDTLNFVRDSSNNAEMFTFDLQRSLEVPSLSTSEAFYCRQLWVYNLCIYDEKRSKAFMYVWDESIASRGAQEVSSCLLKHFASYVPSETKRIILYSDSCGGQNRNIKTTMILKKCLDSWPFDGLESIEQRFYLSGHSYNSCDRCFGVIEKQKKSTERILIPKHWENVIAQAKKSEPKFSVIKMEKEDFLSSVQLEKAITNRKTTMNGEKVNWMNIQKIVNNRSDPFILSFENYSVYSTPPVHISLRKRERKNQIATSISSLALLPLYTKCRPIKRQKYNDLMKLLQYIPEEYWSFYQELECSDDENESKKKRSKPLNYSSDEE